MYKNTSLKLTSYFVIAGILLPGITAVGIFEVQTLLTRFGIECAHAWILVSFFAAYVAFGLPFIFLLYVVRTSITRSRSFVVRLMIFNVFEYICIQASLIPFFTSGKTLCYVTDGQNGIELVFTAWLALPILLLLSFMFDISARVKQKFKSL